MFKARISIAVEVPRILTIVRISLAAIALASLIFTSGCNKSSSEGIDGHGGIPKPKMIVHATKCKANTLKEYKGPISCEGCHEGKIDEVAKSVHYTWAAPVTNIRDISGSWGMKNLFSSMAGGYAKNNWLSVLNENPYVPGGCGRCHVSGVIPTDNPTTADKESIDCLLCHAPAYDMSLRKVVANDSGGFKLTKDDRLETARSVKGPPKAAACERCHLESAGGANYKRGTPYDKATDVHAAKNMYCIDCHKTKNHRMPVGTVSDIYANEVPNVKLDCRECHKELPGQCVNDHERLSCQSCHIPFARGLVFRDFTKLSKNEEGFFAYEDRVEQIRADYFWSIGKGTSSYVPIGSREDKTAKIYPYKKTEVISIADSKSGKLLPLKLSVLKKTGDIEASIIAARKDLAFEYSGKWIPKKSVEYRQMSHAITKDKALKCADCHNPESFFNWSTLRYTKKEINDLTKADKKFQNVTKE